MKGEFVQSCMVTATKLLAPDKITLFQKVSLSRRTVSDWIQEMGDDIEKTQKDRAQYFKFFALALDETAHITNTDQLAIVIRGVTSDFKIQEDLLSLESMHGTTRGDDLLEKLLLAMRKLNLPFEKLSGLTADGPPAMGGLRKRLTALVKKEMTSRGLTVGDLVVCSGATREDICPQAQRFGGANLRSEC